MLLINMPILGPMIRKIKNLILSYRDTILALKASGVSISTLSGATCSRFQSRTVLGKNDIFLVSIREDGIWNDLLCACLVFWPGGIGLFSLLMATNCI